MKKRYLFIVVITLFSIVSIVTYFAINKSKPTFASLCLSIGTGLISSGIVSIFIEINNIANKKSEVNEKINELTAVMYYNASAEYQKLFEYLNYNELINKKFGNLIRLDNRDKFEYVFNNILKSKNKTNIKKGINSVLMEVIKWHDDWIQIIYYYKQTKNYEHIELQKEITDFSNINLNEIDDNEFNLTIKNILTLFDNIFAFIPIINPKIKCDVKGIEEKIINYYGELIYDNVC